MIRLNRLRILVTAKQDHYKGAGENQQGGRIEVGRGNLSQDKEGEEGGKTSQLTVSWKQEKYISRMI
ncbi:MAG: hypothetical protein PQJ50_14730, partial [Spirochaetales bacterium]|nr:hypothetical protein [Spirochaetales bacterium]